MHVVRRDSLAESMPDLDNGVSRGEYLQLVRTGH